MKAIFYDRKNSQEVSSDELMPINLVENCLVTDLEPGDERLLDAYTILIREKCIGELGYKSKHCKKHRNWDLYTNLSDLVFLRLE